MRNSKVQFIVHAAMIAAIYVVLTYFIDVYKRQEIRSWILRRFVRSTRSLRM